MSLFGLRCQSERLNRTSCDRLRCGSGSCLCHINHYQCTTHTRHFSHICTHPHNTGNRRQQNHRHRTQPPPLCRRRCDYYVPSIFSFVIGHVIHIYIYIPSDPLNTAFLHPVSASAHSETNIPKIFAMVCTGLRILPPFKLSIFVSFSRMRIGGARVCAYILTK